MKSRTKARSIALQVLYEVDMVGHPPGTVLEERIIEDPVEKNLADFSSQIIFGVLPLVERLDNFIAQHAP
jgi:transcription antitermination protein NusB